MRIRISSSKPLYFAMICIFFILVMLPSNARLKSTRHSNFPDVYSNQEQEPYSRLLTARTAIDSQIHRTLNEHVQSLKMRQEIQHYLTPEILAEKFVQEFRKTSTKIGLSETEKLIHDYLKPKMVQEAGGISGNFIIPTEYLRRAVTVLAFDGYGYITGIGKTNFYTLTYEIENLQPGEYYVITVSDGYAYVDEMYDNVPAPVFSRQAWRNAKKVTVVAGTSTENIDFELQPSNEFLFTLYNWDGITPSSVDEATFTLTAFDRPDKLLEGFYEYNYTDGEFVFFVPFTGDFKLGVTPPNQPTTWYKSSANWSDADKISIPAFTDKIDSLGLTLNQQGTSADAGRIAGNVTGNGKIKMIFAFKASDLSLTNIGLILYSYYTIEDLEPGEYYVYAEDYLGNISSADDLLGTFYKDAANLAGAEKVTVSAGLITAGINVTLRQGAAIEGRITDQDDNPLSEMLVVALNMDFPEASAFNLFTQMHFGVALTDSTGHYRMAGLFPGDYILRTLSDYTITIFWGLPSFEEGPHKGKVVDEFYQGLFNMFDFSRAQKITVHDTTTVKNIDFRLQKAKFFRGQLSDVSSGESINKALMAALVDSSGFPFYVLPKIDYYGSYELGPFPSGKFRILASADHDQKDFYLPEFYENATTYDEAKALELLNDDLENIDFAFDKAAVIQGHIDIAAGAGYQPAGDDTLFNFPVVLFNAEDGSFSRNAYVQFDGGFRLPRLLPGSYKMVALPIESPFAATYYGGGNRFDDVESRTIQVQAGQILDLSIELEQANGVISGNVTGKTTGEPVANCLVIAYDRTGHAIAMSITDASSQKIVTVPATGIYRLTGLRTDNYYLCTYAFTDESEIAIKIPQYLIAEDIDLFEMVFGLLEVLFATDMNLYADSWYNQVPLRTEFNIPELVQSFLIYGMANEYDHSRYPFYMPIPFQRAIPLAATPVVVTENATVQNVDFQLAIDSMKDVLLDVEADKSDSGLLDDYILLPNVPNPFNSSTRIRFSIPQQSTVKVKIYNLCGQHVVTLADNVNLAPGLHEMQWTGVNSTGQAVPTGLYFVVLQAGNVCHVAKLTLLR